MGIFTYDTRMGSITIQDGPEGIIRVYLHNELLPRGLVREETALLQEACSQLEAYLSGNRKSFTLPLDPRGTPFMKTVWSLLRDIPYGQIASYGQIARLAGSPNASRAVGLACRRNPIPIFIPCHRVVGSNGSLVGFSGGLELKRFLLELEGQNAAG